MAIKNICIGSNRGLARTLAAALGLAALIAGTAVAPARADDDGWHRHQGWHEHEGRGREWREREWREHHPYAYVYPSYRPPGYGYAYAPPPVIYAPPPPPPVYYAPPPGINFVFPIRIH